MRHVTSRACFLSIRYSSPLNSNVGRNSATFSPLSPRLRPRHAFYPMQNYVCGPRTIPIPPLASRSFSLGARQCGTRAGDWRWLSRTRTGYWRAPTNSLARVAAISKCFGVKCFAVVGGRLRSGMIPMKTMPPRVSLSPMVINLPSRAIFNFP